MRSYESFTSRFKSPYNFSSGGASSSVSALWLKRLQEEEARKARSQGIQTGDRSFLDRIGDGLMTGVYTSAGYADGWVKVLQGKANVLEPFKQAAAGYLHGTNVFSNSTDESDEYTYSKVLETAGWKPTTTTGKVAKGTLGFIGDVVFDPTTYMTFGGSALLKGTGRVGTAALKLAEHTDSAVVSAGRNTYERLIEKGVTPELAQRVAKKTEETTSMKFSGATEMTNEIAKVIVERRARDKGRHLGAKELEKDAARFAREYNRVSGIRTGADAATTGITFGVENLPFFGTKLSDKMGRFGKTVEITDGSKLREVSEKLKIAHAYSGLRNQIYGRKLGKMFSTTAPLHKLAQEDPAQLYDFLKFVEITRGAHVNKLDAEARIRTMAKSMNFSPSEQKEILELMQDKTVWSKVRDTIKFADTNYAKELRAALQGSLKKSTDDLESLTEKKRVIDDMRYAIDNNLIEQKDAYKVLVRQYHDELAKLDLTKVKDRESYEKIVDELKGVKSQLDEDARVALTHNGVDMNEFDDLVKAADEEQLKWDEHFKLREHVRAQKAKPGDEVAAGLGDVESVKDVINRSVDDELMRVADEAPGNAAREALVGKLSKYIYGRSDKLMRNMNPKAVRELVDMVKDGASPDDLARFMEEKAHVFSEHASEVYRLLAQRYGYKSWHEKYHKPMERFKNLMDKGIELSPKQYQEYVALQTLNAQRKADFRELFHDMSFDDFKEVRRKEANARMMRELEDEIDLDLEMRRNKFADHDSALLNNMRDMRYADQMERSMDDIGQYLTSTDKSEMFNDALAHYIQSQSARAGKDVSNMAAILGDTGIRTVERLTKSIDEVVKKHFPNRAYQDLTQKQRDFAVAMGTKNMKGKAVDLTEEQKTLLMQESLRRNEMARISAVIDTVKEGHILRFKHDGEDMVGKVLSLKETENGTKYLVKTPEGNFETLARDVTSVKTLDKHEMSVEEIIKQSPLTSDVMKQREALQSQIDDVLVQLGELDGKYAEKQKEVFTYFKKRATEQHAAIKELEETSKVWETRYRELDEGEIERLSKHIEDTRAAMESDDAFESYVRLNYGEKAIDDVLDSVNNINSVRIALDDRTDNEVVKNWTMTLFEEFKRMGASEVSIGKLKQEQFDAMLGQYVPHILTKEGQKYIDGIDDLKDVGKSLTRDLGYGVKWNPFSQSRTIEGKTIEEINAHFAELLKGKNLFSDNLSEIYVARAMKHTELMYDDHYMKTMLDVFGTQMKVGDVIADGHKAVANYGQLRELIAKLVKEDIKEAAASGVKPSKELWDKFTKANISELGLPQGILDDFATPMVELNQAQLERLVPHGIAFNVNDAIVMKANQARKMQIAKDQSRFLTMYDKFLHWIKLNQTTVMPSFHVRNKLSNMYLNWLGVGSDAVNPRMQRAAWLAAHHEGDMEKLAHLAPLEIRDASGNVRGVLAWDQVYQLALRHRAIDEGFFAKDIGAGAATKGLIKRAPAKYDPTDTENFLLYKLGSTIGSKIENSDRLIHFASMLRRGKTPEEAAASSKKYLFDYADLTAFEQTYMKRLMPYYTWLRKNGRLQVSELLAQPGKYRDTQKVMTGIDNMNNEEDQVDENQLAPFARDWVQSPFSAMIPDSVSEENPEGERAPIMMNPNLPFMDLGRLPNPLEPIESGRNLLAQSSPLMKVPLELAMNQNFFFDEELIGENDNAASSTMAHIARQLALYNAGEGVVTKDGTNLGLHVLNSLTGVKGVAYDEQTMKNMQMKRLIDKLQAQEGVPQK